MKTTLSARATRISPSATLEINAISRRLKAEGKPVISFSVGEPDFPTPKFIVDAAKSALDDSANFKYTQSAGLPKLRELIAAKTERESGAAGINAENVVVTNGGKQAVFEALSCILDEGDEMLLPAPYWLTYPEVIEYNGAKVVAVKGEKSRGYKVTADQLRAALTSKTKALLLTSPNNPTGSVYSLEELKQIGEFCLKSGIWVVADEIYENLAFGSAVYLNGQAPHILQACPELEPQTLILNGTAKSYSMTGWRLGWVVAPLEVAKAINSLQSHLTSNVNNITQVAGIAALENEAEAKAAIDGMKAEFEVRGRKIRELLGRVFDVAEPDGAFYAFCDVSRQLNRELKNGKTAQTAAELAKMLLEDCFVACVPMEGFGIDGHIRFSYALSEGDIIEGCTRIVEYFA